MRQCARAQPEARAKLESLVGLARLEGGMSKAGWAKQRARQERRPLGFRRAAQCAAATLPTSNKLLCLRRSESVFSVSEPRE